MSRTIRRNNKWLERRYLGTVEDFDESHYMFRLNQARDVEQAFAKLKARFHRCRPTGVWGSASHWYRRTLYNVPERRLATHLCHQVAKGVEDDVVMPGRLKGANSSYLWSIT